MRQKLIKQLIERTAFDEKTLSFLIDAMIKIMKDWHIHDILVLFNEE